MRTLYIFPVLAIAIISCKDSKPEIKKFEIQIEKTELELNPKYKGSFFHENDKDSSAFFSFDIILTNYTDKVVEFWTMSCTPQINIVVDSDQLNFFIPRCSGNVPIIIKLSPKQQFVVPIVVQLSSHDIKGFNSQSRFGFIINKPKYKLGIKKSLDYDQDPFMEFREMRETKENVIWSKSFDLFGYNEFLYEIRNIINDSTYYVLSTQRLLELR